MLKIYQSFLIALLLSGYASYSHAVLDVVIVSAARTEQSALTTPASITVITRDEIDTSGARHVAVLSVDLPGCRNVIRVDFEHLFDGLEYLPTTRMHRPSPDVVTICRA